MNDADLELLKGRDSEKMTGMALNEKASTFWEGDFNWEGAGLG